LGHWAFRDLDVMVDPRVLIPRPETEQVVEVAIEELRRIRAGRAERKVTAVDLGTGSGVIALSLAAAGADAVWATDREADALAVARANIAGTGGAAATKVRLSQGSWWQ